MDSPIKEVLLKAGRTAQARYPGAVGELLSQELFSWMVFGHRLGSDLIVRVAAEVLTEGVDDAGPLPGPTGRHERRCEHPGRVVPADREGGDDAVTGGQAVM